MSPTDHVPFHRNPKVIAVFSQLLIATLLAGFLYWIYSNTIENLNRAGIQTGFGFLDQVAPFKVGFSAFLEFKLGESTYWRVFWIGVQNTIFVSILGIIAATLLGFTVGIMRLSPNWIISRFALVYIETLRNIPLLLQILFWNFAIFLPFFPVPKDSISIADSIFINKRGLYLPKVVSDNPTGTMIVAGFIIAAIVGAFYLRNWAKKRQNETGQTFPVFTASLAAIIVMAFLGVIVSGFPLSLELPELGRFNLKGGVEYPLPLFSLWFALSTYTAAFIAENVRAGIQAVPKGQTEASSALGLKRNHVLNLVVIPQAMRIIIPPTISQYLNLTKNSSLAVAVAFEELFAIWAGISLNQTGQALVIIGMTFLVYQILSMITSAAANYYNKRSQFVGR
ncbi:MULTISPECIES: amino acid ABC transporter permease [unclassified Lentilitoribacter]|uniref:amino acid ABC transporter permease n=1 Tax=unclassified Lentilitoribacter TaxID=2647570 RepID=UPI0013A6919D|nr:ABC transporter permease subunit [Lentilitoribacter sp. Alg239-R112]